MVRLKTDGKLDWGFANGGKITVTFDRGGTKEDYGEAVMIDASGRIVVAGHAAGATYQQYDFAVARLLGDGSLDLPFGTNGRVRVAFDIGGDKTDDLRAMAIGLDGGIVLAGTVDTLWDLRLLGVARLLGASWISMP